MDSALLHLLNGTAARHDAFEDVWRVLALDGPVLLVALLAGLALAGRSWRSPAARRGAVAAAGSALAALALAQVLAHAWVRTRPYAADPGGVHLFIAASGDPSFPSDHAAAAFAIAIALLLRHRRGGWAALGLALCISIGRVVVGTHYPSDVAGGALLGSLTALALWHPAVRAPLHRLADMLGRRYDALLA